MTRPRPIVRVLLATALVGGTGWYLWSPQTISAAPTSIHVTQVKSAEQPPCVPALLALQREVADTPTSFTLTVTAPAAPCNAIDAVAVIYRMPSATQQWPQTLSEHQAFTINAAGVTTITFDKGCDPVQFDVVTGDTPQEISPLGAHHGPLLFPLDMSTSLQYPGDPEDCEPTTTTTTTTPPAIVSTSTASTTTPTVLPATTERPATTTTAAPATTATVAAATATRSAGAALSITG